MKLTHVSLLAATLGFSAAHAQPSSNGDLWDVAAGAVVTGGSDIMPWAGSPLGLLGDFGQNNSDGITWTYFMDGQPADFVHYIEWETPTDVTLGQIRLYAFGDGAVYNDGREFAQFTLKAKSPGSSTYDITVLTFTPTHPYHFVDPFNYLVLDQVITPLAARSFRAEFLQYNAGNGWDGPRIVELDGLPVMTPPTSSDLFDVAQGAVVTSSSALHPAAGTAAGFLGLGGQMGDGNSWTYFADDQPADTVHFIEWETTSDVTVGQIRLYGFGDGPGVYNNGREFDQFTLKAKSPGSDTYDVTVLTFNPTHPYSYVDPYNFLVLNQAVAPVTAHSFRAEFLQYNAGNGWDGPRIVELDALPPLNPPSDPPPSDPPPSDPPPSDPPPSDPPPSDPPPSDPPPSDPPPSDPPPSDPPPSDPPPSDPPPSDPPPSDPPPSDPPPSDPPPSDPPPSDPPPSDPPPSDPPPSDPPPSDPPPAQPPVIVAGPQSVTANYGMPVGLTVEATGTGALQYQWFKNGDALAGQTSDTLWIGALAATDVGNYHVTVADDGASVASSDATVALDTVNILPSNFDLWDSNNGATITLHTAYGDLGSPEGMFGAGSSFDDSGSTYFVDGRAVGCKHIVDWETPVPVQVNTIRLFARGMDSGDREFGAFTLKAKSPGSASFDIVVGRFTPSHPYTMLDPTTSAILDIEIAPILATAFRAEFEQFGASGPRILELDAFTSRPLVEPAIVVDVKPQTALKNTQVTFNVVARGGSLKYQWCYNAKPIVGATADTLTIDTAKVPDRGCYSVIVSNPLGSVSSSRALLQVVNKNGH